LAHNLATLCLSCELKARVATLVIDEEGEISVRKKQYMLKRGNKGMSF
jgi:hypothetical protein